MSGWDIGTSAVISSGDSKEDMLIEYRRKDRGRCGSRTHPSLHNFTRQATAGRKSCRAMAGLLKVLVENKVGVTNNTATKKCSFRCSFRQILRKCYSVYRRFRCSF